MAIDLGADRLVGAEQNGEKIAVEIKSFLLGTSAISEFHTALGQYINYRGALKLRGIYSLDVKCSDGIKSWRLL